MAKSDESKGLVRRPINAPETPAPLSGGYAQACEVTGAKRILFTSGQTPVTADGAVPESFAEQAKVAWRNVLAQLRAADMTLENLAKVTTYLSDRTHLLENRQIRAEILGSHSPALTVIFVELFDPKWFIEIEAIAVA
jgi:2-iminobutanoate/2-iminopropanoate deaminase